MISCTNLSYEEVEINTPPEQTIIYLDPPYRNTTTDGYGKQELDYDKLYKWCEEMSKKGYKVFMSEYNVDGVKCIFERDKRSQMSPIKDKRNKRLERLFLWD